MSEDVSNLVKYLIATSLTNINCSRVRSSSQHSRSEGWTEVFGNTTCRVPKKTKSSEERAGVGRTTGGGGGGDVNVEGVEGKDEEDDNLYWEVEDDFVRRSGENKDSPPTALRISQWRVAWQEQVLLRMAGIPHTVGNSPHAATESCGALPYVVDIDANSSTNGRGSGSALVGRHTHNNGRGSVNASGTVKNDDGNTTTPNEKTSIKSKNQILNYLLQCSNYDIALPDSKFTDAEKAQSYAFTTLIENELDVILLALRFGNTSAWDDVYRHQAINASIDPDSLLIDDNTEPPKALLQRVFPFLSTTASGDTHRTNDVADEERRHSNSFHPISWFQAWSERTIALQGLTAKHSIRQNHLFQKGTREVHLDTALDTARSCYAVLDHALGKILPPLTPSLLSDDYGLITLFGTETPALVDTLLFAHLAEAMCNVHLVTVLGDYTHLLKFFETMYERYFGTGYADRWRAGMKNKEENDTTDHDDSDVCWIACNDLRNAANRFNRIPKIPPPKIGKGGLKEAIIDGALQRREDLRISLDNQRKNVGKMMHCLRMGGKMGKMMDMDGNNRHSSGKGRTAKASAPKTGGGGGGDSTDSDGEDDTDNFARKNRHHMAKLKKEAKIQDELWISGVIVTTIFGFVLAASNT